MTMVLVFYLFPLFAFHEKAAILCSVLIMFLLLKMLDFLAFFVTANSVRKSLKKREEID